MLSAIYTALSGLTAFARQVNVTANNVANVNTNGFKKSTTTFIETVPGGVDTTVQRDTSSGPQVLQETAQGPTQVELSNVDVGQEAANLIVGQRGFEANLKVIQATDSVLGSILDIRD